MKKILFITTRNPYSKRYSGDVIRSLKIINLLKEKYELDVVSLSNNSNPIKEKNVILFKYPNFFFKVINCLSSIFKLKPIQFGLFFSKEMKTFIENFSDNYDYMFFYHVRSSQYLPETYRGKTILEMGDLYSDNYLQTFNYLNFLNPLKYIYYFESLLVRRAEYKIFSNFDRIVLFSKHEMLSITKEFKKKIFQIDESIHKIKKKFLFSKRNNRILFIGNLNYLPNLLACKDFIKNILPRLIREIPDVKFSIIGNISNFNKILLSKKRSVEILGPQKDISRYVKNSFCGLANLKIATGVQGKVLTYMSFGLPAICSKKVAKNFGLSVVSFNEDAELLKHLLTLKNNKTKSIRLSKNSIKFLKNLDWNKVKIKYLKLLKF